MLLLGNHGIQLSILIHILLCAARPTVQLIEKTHPDPHEVRELICTSLEFYPDDIQVSWFKDGERITNGIKNGALDTNSDGSFSSTSFLSLSASEWNKGETYSCQVNHSTLSAPTVETICVSNPDARPDIIIAWTIVVRLMILVMATLIAMAAFKLCFRSHDTDDEFERPCLNQTIKLQTDLIRTNYRKEP
ncbi:hypothetical protein chiPu_0002799 [Chiloscyllium punctatum]|uniref:Ig-like domain-containing protein n=1 Tax=Chiloscyllium punctatum TaxID=137246 RepID=A0A401S1X9_CHIPU|nr:hypothetical protein [Chiloscyllium punctatum]